MPPSVRPKLEYKQHLLTLKNACQGSKLVENKAVAFLGLESRLDGFSLSLIRLCDNSKLGQRERKKIAAKRSKVDFVHLEQIKLKI